MFREVTTEKSRWKRLEKGLNLEIKKRMIPYICRDSVEIVLYIDKVI